MEESIASNIDLYQYLIEKFDMEKQDIKTVSPLTLAYIGDGIYDIIVRSLIIAKGNAPVNKLHKHVSEIVKAQSQMELHKAIEDIMTDEEKNIFKRGRNAKSYTSAKNASKSDYRNATGLEALLGYLYMNGDMSRILYLVRYGFDRLSEAEIIEL